MRPHTLVAIAASAALGLGPSGCSPPVRDFEVVPLLPESCLAGQTVSQVRVSALGDFPPAQSTVASTTPMGVTRFVVPSNTKVIAVEGLGPGGVVAFGRTAPLALGSAFGRQVALAYGPLDGLCTAASFHLNYARAGHRATRLASGEVLISGGVDAGGVGVPRLERYRPVGDRFSPAATFEVVDIAGVTEIDRRAALGHAVAPLLSGGVIITGGAPADGGRASGTAFEGMTLHGPDGVLVGTPGLLGGGPRAFHTATALTDGRVVITGGCAQLDADRCVAGAALASTVIFNPTSGRFTDGPPLRRARWDHDAVLRPDGAILIVGGRTEAPGDPPLEVLDPDEPRGFDAGALAGRAALLPTGAVAVVGGTRAALWLPDAILDLERVATARTGHTVTALEDGAALVAGPTDLLVLDGRGTARMIGAFGRTRHAATPLLDGSVLLTGGVAGTSAVTSAAIYLRSPLGPYSTVPTVTFDAPADPWLPRRFDRARVADGKLELTAPAAGEGGRPGELVLLSAMTFDALILDLFGGRIGPAPAAAALILGWQSDASYAFLALEPGRPVALFTVAPGRAGLSVVAPVEGCAGKPLEEAELPDGDLAKLIVTFRAGTLEIGNPTRSFLRCVPKPAIGRGAVGVAALFGTVAFDNLEVTR